MSGFSKFIIGVDKLFLADWGDACQIDGLISGLQIPLDIVARLKEAGGSQSRLDAIYTTDDFLPRKVAEAERYLKC
jgi:hypothetical protein